MENPPKYCKAFSQGPVVFLDRKNEEGWPIVFATENVEDLLGYTRKELGQGDVFYAGLIHPEDREGYERKVAFYSASGVQRFCHETYRLIAKDKRVIYVLDYTTIVRDEAGKVSNYIGYIIDVTELTEKEAAIERGRQRLELIVEAAGLGTWDLEIPSGKIFYNRIWTEMLGYGPDDVENTVETRDSLIHPDDLDYVKRELSLHLSGQSPYYETKSRRRTEDGGWKWILSRGRVVSWDKDGNPVRMVGVHQDITERIKLLDDLREKEQKIAEAYRFFRLTIDNVPDMIWVKDMDKRYLFANKTTCDFLGAADTDEPIGKDDMFFVKRSRAQRTDRPDWHTFGEICQNSDDIVMQNRRKQRFDEFGNVRGEFLFLDVHKAPFFDENGDIIGTVGAGRDVTREKQLEKEKDEVQRQLLQAQKLEAIGRIAGGIAHDLNNFLVPVLGYADMGLKELRPDDRLYKYLSEIKKGAERAAGIVKQILVFGKKQAFMPVCLDINRLIHDLEATLFKLMGEGITVQILAAPDLKSVLADKNQLDQAIMNLVINAKDAMPEGGVIRIETANVFKARHGGRRDDYLSPHVMLSVIDTGCGMTEEVQKRKFEPFFTTKPLEKGTGLGLSVVYGIVRQHGGFIEVFSEPGKGTAFKLYFPVADAFADTEKDMTNQCTATTLASSERFVLVVDDEEQICELITSVLEQSGYEVLSFTRPDELIKVIKDKRPRADILITDLMMPGMNGTEVFKRLKEIYPDLKVIYMSGYTQDIVAIQKDLDQGAIFLQKPFSIKGLLDTLVQTGA